MTNLTKTLNNYIKQNITGVVIYNDLFPKAELEGVISVHDPATKKVNEFIDGSTESQVNISYTARYAKAEKAREVLTKILDLLDGARLVDTADGLRIKARAVANVQFIGVDDKNNSIYTSSVNATYTTLQE